MRFSAAMLLFCLSAAVALASPQEYDYEDAGDAVDEKVEARPPPPPPAPRRPGLPTAPRKSPLARSRPTPSTSTTTPPPPPEESEPISEEEEVNGEEEGEIGVSEPPTKKPLLRGGVRPFRSNQDLLEILKRRRLNVKVSTHAPEDKDEPTPAPSSPAPKRRFNGNNRAAAKVQAAEDTEESKSASRPRSGRRFSSPRGRVTEEVEEEQPVAEEPRSRTGRRRF